MMRKEVKTTTERPAWEAIGPQHAMLFADGGTFAPKLGKKKLEPPAQQPPKYMSGKKLVLDRDEFEKSRISHRTRTEGGMDQSELRANVTGQVDGSPAKLPENQRFRAGMSATCDELKKEQEAKRRSKDAVLEKKRENALRKERERWDAEIKAKDPANRVSHEVKVNRSLAHYDIVTFEYNNDSEGQRLKNKDLRREERHKARSRELYRKANSYNPITGEDIQPVK